MQNQHLHVGPNQHALKVGMLELEIGNLLHLHPVFFDDVDRVIRIPLVDHLRIHQPERHVEDPDTGQRLLAGTDLLVSGPLTTGLVGEHVLSGLAITQGNVLSHIKAMSVHYEHYMRRANGNFNRPLEASLLDASYKPMYGLVHTVPTRGMASPLALSEEHYVRLSRKPEWRDLFSLVERPVVYMTLESAVEERMGGARWVM